MNPDFVEFLAALLAADARFLVVGAHALAVHGVPRATGDIDVWIATVIPRTPNGSGERSGRSAPRPRPSAFSRAIWKRRTWSSRSGFRHVASTCSPA